MPNENNIILLNPEVNNKLIQLKNEAKERCKMIGENSNCPIEFSQTLENLWIYLNQQRLYNNTELQEKQQEKNDCEKKIKDTEDLIDQKNTEKQRLIREKQEQIEADYEKLKREKTNYYDKKISDINTEIDKNKEEINKLQDKIRKEYDSIPFIPKTNIRLIMEILLGFLLLCYLWIFYSTATYSAFFKDADSLSSNIVSVFLDPTAMSSAWAQGWGVGLFITLFPFIFVALGYITFTKENSVDNSDTEQNAGFFKNITKRMQVIGILCGAFVYDVLIAYIIAENVYKQTIELGREQQFNLHICLRDPHFWLIIGAGFVVYLIFGWICNTASERWLKLNPQENNINKYKYQIKELENNNKNLTNTIKNDLEEQKFKQVGNLQDNCTTDVLNVEQKDSEVLALDRRIGEYTKDIENYNNKIANLEGRIQVIKAENSISENDMNVYRTFRDEWIAHLASIKNQDLVRECHKKFDEFMNRHNGVTK